MSPRPDEMAGVHQALGILAGKMDRVIATCDRMEERRDANEMRAEERHDALEARVCKVENRQHWYSGAAAVVGAIISAFVSHKFT